MFFAFSWAKAEGSEQRSTKAVIRNRIGKTKELYRDEKYETEVASGNKIEIKLICGKNYKAISPNHKFVQDIKQRIFFHNVTFII